MYCIMYIVHNLMSQITYDVCDTIDMICCYIHVMYCILMYITNIILRYVVYVHDWWYSVDMLYSLTFINLLESYHLCYLYSSYKNLSVPDRMLQRGLKGE